MNGETKNPSSINIASKMFCFKCLWEKIIYIYVYNICFFFFFGGGGVLKDTFVMVDNDPTDDLILNRSYAH